MFTSYDAAKRRAYELSAKTSHRYGIAYHILLYPHHYEWRYEPTIWPY